LYFAVQYSMVHVSVPQSIIHNEFKISLYHTWSLGL
jgi:hypothetical protein